MELFNPKAESKLSNVEEGSLKKVGAHLLYAGDVLDTYQEWDTPKMILSDGAYGVSGFPGDPKTPGELGEWYRPHIEKWAEGADLTTSLWLWNTEVGWANIHPVLVEHGWEYVFTGTWNKGVGHIAGNVNSKTIRQMPVVTEVCVLYTRTPLVPRASGSSEKVHLKEWLLSEWVRSGLSLREANQACGVKSAATRKYFSQDHLWYYPPREAMKALVGYANKYGEPEGRPYYSFDGVSPISGEELTLPRSVWNHKHGLTNVWDRPPLRSSERFKGSMKKSSPRSGRPTKNSATHLNQKPLDLMKMLIEATTNPGDVIWEPFGGLFTGVVAAEELGRRGFGAEKNPLFFELGEERVQEALKK